jgi:hypothetical protein
MISFDFFSIAFSCKKGKKALYSTWYNSLVSLAKNNLDREAVMVGLHLINDAFFKQQ